MVSCSLCQWLERTDDIAVSLVWHGGDLAAIYQVCRSEWVWESFFIIIDVGQWPVVQSASISTTKVRSSSNFNKDRPTDFLKHCFTLRTSLSQKLPHQGAGSTMNCQSTCLFARYRFTSLDLEIFLTSTVADLKVFALSVNNFAESPLRLTNLRTACKRDFTVKLSVNSRWTARVDVNRQRYALLRFSGDAELT